MEVYFDNLTADDASLEKLVEDVSLLVQDAEALMRASGNQLPEQKQQELAGALARLKARAQRAKEQAMTGVQATDRVIRRYPYQSLGVVFALGVLVGALVNWRNGTE